MTHLYQPSPTAVIEEVIPAEIVPFVPVDKLNQAERVPSVLLKNARRIKLRSACFAYTENV